MRKPEIQEYTKVGKTNVHIQDQKSMMKRERKGSPRA